MANDPPAQLAGFLASLGEVAEATQRRLDAAHCQDVETFTTSVAPHLVRLDASLVASLAPPRQVVREMSFSGGIDLTVQRSGGLVLSVEPLGIGAAQRFAVSTATASKLTMTVIAVPHSLNCK